MPQFAQSSSSRFAVVAGPRPAGQAVNTAVPVGSPYGALGTSAVTAMVDANGTTALFDPSGNLIAGTVRDIEGSPAPDTLFNGATARAATAADTARAATQASLTPGPVGPLAQLQAWAATPAGTYAIGAAMAVAAVGLVIVAAQPQDAPRSRRARRNPSRRRRSR